jgi:uridine kinase
VLARYLLEPLGPGGDRQYLTGVIDLETDSAVAEPTSTASKDAVLVVDATFLQRPEIRDLWDERIWIDTSLRIARHRGVERDAGMLGGREAADRLFAVRYHGAAQIYINAVAPAKRATVVLGTSDQNTRGWVFATILRDSHRRWPLLGARARQARR